MSVIPRPLLLVVALSLAIAGCGSADDWSKPHPKPTAVGTLGVGFVDRDDPPAPEATIAPRPGSWNEVRPSKGYRVVLLTTDADAPTRTMVKAVKEWADDVDASLKTVIAKPSTNLLKPIGEAVALEPDLIIAAGNPLVDPLAIVTANHLAQPFLVIGAELAEPTHNVTAADWSGAAYRGEGLGLPSKYDPRTFTPERSARAIRAGVAAVLNGITGIILDVR
jgi:hypothetical protein